MIISLINKKGVLMPAQPMKRKYTCTCGYTRIHQPKSDALSSEDIKAQMCPRCQKIMQSRQPSIADGALDIISFLKLWGKKPS